MIYVCVSSQGVVVFAGYQAALPQVGTVLICRTGMPVEERRYVVNSVVLEYQAGSTRAMIDASPVV